MQKKVHSIGGADASGTDANVLVITSEGGIGFQVTGGGTWTLGLEATMDGPTETDAVWVGVKYYDVAGGGVSAGTTVSAAAIGYVDLPGFGAVRLRQTAGAGTPTSWLSETVDE